MMAMREREIVLMEKQTEHRMGLEKQVIESDVSNSRLGMNYAFALTLACLLVTVLFMWKGYPTQAASFAAAVIVSLATAFVYGKYGRAKELATKNSRLTSRSLSQDTVSSTQSAQSQEAQKDAD